MKLYRLSNENTKSSFERTSLKGHVATVAWVRVMNNYGIFFLKRDFNCVLYRQGNIEQESALVS